MCLKVVDTRRPLGIFPRNLCGGLLGLRKCFCNLFLFQWARTAISVGPHWTPGSPRSFHRCSSVVLQFVGCNWVYLGVFTEANKTSRRYHQVSSFLHTRHRLFRGGHGPVPTALSRHLSPIVAPAPALSEVEGLRVKK